MPTMPFIGNRWTSDTAAVTFYPPNVASIIDELSSSQLSKTARRFSFSTALPFRGSSRSQKFRKEAAVGECPKGQNYYACSSTGFKGCCSNSACDPGVVCPENSESKETSSAITDTTSIASTQASSAHDTATGTTISRSETSSVKSSVTSATGQPVQGSTNATVIRATEDVALAPSCPGGNGTTYTDNDKIAYVVRCASDNSAASFNSVQIKIGGYAQCFSNCSGSGDCAGFTYVGLDDGTCYLKSTMPKESYVAKAGSNYISCNKIDPLASVTRPSTTATETSTSSTEASAKQPNKGAIAGGVVGGLAIIALLLLLIAFLARRRRKDLESKRATMTHIFGGAVEPRRREEDDPNALPLHNRNGSTSHDLFAPYGGMFKQPQYSSVPANEYQPQHARQRSTYRPPGETNWL